uniref:Ig-like domain-containing protein n=1 Tax=Fundulus heteroclitus TaxID=8078 RepID=A0A3Q2T831_FUNHE
NIIVRGPENAIIGLSSSGNKYTEVICVLSESCMLPCWLSYGSDPLIHWFYVSDGESVVHSYYKDQDQLQHQVENFKNRTSLFQDQISRGNASLLLRRVKVQDEGKYKCYSSTTGGFEQSFVNLKAEGRIALLDRFYFLLVFISSSLMVSDDDPYLTYSCTVSTQRSRKTVTISKEGDTGGEQLLYQLITVSRFFAPHWMPVCKTSRPPGESNMVCFYFICIMFSPRLGLIHVNVFCKCV